MADAEADRRLTDGQRPRFSSVVAVADRLPLADGAFDAAVSSFVFQLVPNRARALREARRVLRPDGLLAYVSWLDGERVGDFRADTVFDEVLDDFEFDPAEGDDRSGDIPSVDRAASELRRAGFAEVTVREGRLAHRFTVDGYIGFLTEFDEESLFAELEPDLRDDLLRHARDAPDGAQPGADDDARPDRVRDRSPVALTAPVTRRRTVSPRPTPRCRPRPRPPRRPRPRQLRPRRPRLHRRRPALSSTRGAWTLAMISSPSVTSVTSAGMTRSRTWMRGVEVDQRLDRVLDRLRQVIRQRPDPDRLDRMEQRAAVERRRPATRRSSRAARPPSAPRSCGRGTGRRGASGG